MFFNFRWLNSVDADEMVVDDQAIIPSIPAGVSGTALAASLLRDGWSVSTGCFLILVIYILRSSIIFTYVKFSKKAHWTNCSYFVLLIILH